MRKEHNNETKPSCQKKLRQSNKSICQASLKMRAKKINVDWKRKQEQGNKSEAMEKLMAHDEVLCRISLKSKDFNVRR
jgi:hypothetical protein